MAHVEMLAGKDVDRLEVISRESQEARRTNIPMPYQFYVISNVHRYGRNHIVYHMASRLIDSGQVEAAWSAKMAACFANLSCRLIAETMRLILGNILCDSQIRRQFSRQENTPAAFLQRRRSEKNSKIGISRRSKILLSSMRLPGALSVAKPT